MSYKISWKLHVSSNILAILMTIPLYNFINSINKCFCSSSYIFSPTKFILVNYYIYILILLIVVTILHELIHGLIYKLLGGKIKFGFRVIYAYTQEISGLQIKRNYFIVVLLAPLIILTCICLFFDNYLTNMGFIINLLGSSGDIIMAATVIRYSNKSKIIDKSYGYEVVKDSES
jgi:hypothetical protein